MIANSIRLNMGPLYLITVVVFYKWNRLECNAKRLWWQPPVITVHMFSPAASGPSTMSSGSGPLSASMSKEGDSKNLEPVVLGAAGSKRDMAWRIPMGIHWAWLLEERGFVSRWICGDFFKQNLGSWPTAGIHVLAAMGGPSEDHSSVK